MELCDRLGRRYFFLSHSLILPLRYKVKIKGVECLIPKDGDKKLFLTLFPVEP